jgi:hypothetical protein
MLWLHETSNKTLVGHVFPNFRTLPSFEKENPSCDPTNSKTSLPTTPFFAEELTVEPMSKRRRGYPSESNVKRGVRIVHGEKLLEEKLGRNDPCPCGSNKRFKQCCMRRGRF